MTNNKKLIKMLNLTPDNDIRYRGPLSYRHLTIMGWLGITFMMIGVWTSLGLAMDPNSPQWMVTLNTVSTTLGGFSLPLFLLANFCTILDEKKAYKELLIKNAILTLLVVVVFEFVFRRYIYGLVNLFLQDPVKTNKVIADLMMEGTRTGDLAFNLFIDLFLCTLFMFFLSYEPQKGFFARHRLVFRWLAVIPVIYEAGSLAIRMLSASRKIVPPIYIYPFLTTKAPLTFVMFVMLALYIKNREYLFLKNGKTKEEYKAFLKTNTNSWQFSVYASIILIVTCLIDLILLIVFILNISMDSSTYISSFKAGNEKGAESEASSYMDDETIPPELADGYSYMAPYAEDIDEDTVLGVILEEAGLIPPEEESTESDSENLEEAVDKSLRKQVLNVIITDASLVTYGWGFGKHVQLIVLLPFLFLLDYTKVHKSKKIDTVIPFAGIALAVIVSVECIYQGIYMFVSSVANFFVK